MHVYKMVPCTRARSPGLVTQRDQMPRIAESDRLLNFDLILVRF